MKKIIGIILSLFVSIAFGQTFPVHNLTVNGTASFSGATAFTLSPTAPTPAVGTNNTSVATMAAIAAHNTPCQSILDYGGVNDGVTDNLAAWARITSAQSANNVCVYFPQGSYYFSNTAAYTFTNAQGSITIEGAGADVTTLLFSHPSAPGIAIVYDGAYDSAHIRDLTVASTIGGSNNTGIFLQQSAAIANPADCAQSDITGVTVRGADGYVVTDAWSYGIEVSSVSQVNFINDLITGPTAGTVGVLLTGSATAFGVVYNFIGCTINFVGIGIEYAGYIQGVTVGNSNFTGGNDGIFTPSGQAGLDELLVWGCQFASNQNGILLQTGIESVQIFGNLFLVANNGNGINLNFAGNNAITGNTFEPDVGSPVGNNGLVISGTINNWPNIITGNSFNQMAGSGILLNAGSKFNNIQSNVYFGNGTNITNSGTSNTLGGGSQ